MGGQGERGSRGGTRGGRERHWDEKSGKMEVGKEMSGGGGFLVLSKTTEQDRWTLTSLNRDAAMEEWFLTTGTQPNQAPGREERGTEGELPEHPTGWGRWLGERSEHKKKEQQQFSYDLNQVHSRDRLPFLPAQYLRRKGLPTGSLSSLTVSPSRTCRLMQVVAHDELYAKTKNSSANARTCDREITGGRRGAGSEASVRRGLPPAGHSRARPGQAEERRGVAGPRWWPVLRVPRPCRAHTGAGQQWEGNRAS